MSYCVYKHTFPNGKVYIGITSKKPEYRWGKNGTAYVRRRKNGEYDQPLIAKAILKYGWDNIEHEVLFDGLAKEEAEQKEIELIAEYKSNQIEYGYNIANGGNTSGTHSKETIEKIRKAKIGKNHPFYGTHRSDETKKKISKSVLCIETGEIYDSIKSASEKTNISYNGISDCCRGKHKTAGGYHWEFADDRLKNSVSEYKSNNMSILCIETGIVYKGQNEASRQTGIPKTSIWACLHKKLKTAGGYHWIFVNDSSSTKYKKSIRCIETNEIYESITIASSKTGITTSNISNVCHGRQKTAGGYRWEYVEENS